MIYNEMQDELEELEVKDERGIIGTVEDQARKA